MAVQETMRVMRGTVYPVWTRVVRSRAPGAVLVRVDAGFSPQPFGGGVSEQ